MSPATDAIGPSERSPEPLWHLVQHQMIEGFNELNDARKVNFKCWPVVPCGKDLEHCSWIVVIITDAFDIHPDATSHCKLRIDESSWWEATRIANPSATISLDGRDHGKYVTLKVKVSRDYLTQSPFSPVKIAPRPICNDTECLSGNLRLTGMKTLKIMDDTRFKRVLDAAWKFHDPKHYGDIYRWATEEEFEFEAAAIRDFNRKSVYQCWLVLCHPSEDQLNHLDQKEDALQQCIVIIASGDPHESFPKIGDLVDLSFDTKIPDLDAEYAEITNKDNQSLKRTGVKYFRGVRVDNPHDKFSLEGSNWNNYSTFKVTVHRKLGEKDARDYSPFTRFTSQADPTTLVSRHRDVQKPRVTLKDASSFQAHIWLDISDTTKSVELNALVTAVRQPPDSQIYEAFSYIRTFENTSRNRSFNLLRALPHMQSPDGTNSQLPETLKASFRDLDNDQKQAYKTVLSDLPCRVGIFPGGPGVGKTELMLTTAAIAMSKYAARAEVCPATTEAGQTAPAGCPILLIVEANRPANATATRVVEYFQRIGRTDLRIIRSFNFNYEGAWSTRRYLRVEENDEESDDFDFDECFPTHHADHIPPRVRMGTRDECLASTLKEAAQQYLALHPEDFPLLSKLLNTDPDKIRFGKQFDDEGHHKEWDDLFIALLARTDFVVTTPIGAAKISEYFCPRLVIFDDAACARELSTLVAIAHFPSAEAWLFTGTCAMKKPYVASHGNPKLWNPCADQLRTSMMERCLHAIPDMPSLAMNHQAYGDLHTLSSDLFWDGQIESALPSNERFPPSTLHLLEYCRNLASDPNLSVPRLLVHVKGSWPRDSQKKSKFNKNHLEWVVTRLVRDLVQDRDFRSTDGKQPGRIIIVTPYKAQFTMYRKEINDLMKALDREHRLAGGHGERLHRDVLVEARTNDTVQGQMADVIIYDLVHSELTSHVADGNRMCVALTRAKQAEIIVMEKSMLGREDLVRGRRRPGPDVSYVDLLYEHCKSNGQVISVGFDEESHVETNYGLQQPSYDGPWSNQSVVPRRLPDLPPSLAQPRDSTQVGASRDVPTSDTEPPQSTHAEDDENVFHSGENFGYEMVRKAMELGLNLSSDFSRGQQ